MCILIILCPVFLNWVCWARGNFLASRVTYIFAGVSFRCVECRAGTSIFGCFVGVGGGAVRIFYSLGSLLAGTVQLKWWDGWGAFPFHFLQFVVSPLGGWICAVGILRYIFIVFCSGFLRFLLYKLLIVDNLLQVVSESSAP